MLAPLRITQRVSAGVTILDLSGRLVFDEGALTFRDRISALVQAGTTNLLLDLRNVSAVDSGGVGALVAMYLHVTRRGGQYKLLCPSPRSCEVLRISHLNTVFEVFYDEAEALRSFATSPAQPQATDPHRVAG